MSFTFNSHDSSGDLSPVNLFCKNGVKDLTCPSCKSANRCFFYDFPCKPSILIHFGYPHDYENPHISCCYSCAQLCRDMSVSLDIRYIYIYIITYTSTWVINDYAVWNAGPHVFFWRVSKMGTSDVSRNSLQLFESDPYGCHSQADPDRGWEIHSIDVPNSSKFPLVG